MCVCLCVSTVGFTNGYSLILDTIKASLNTSFYLLFSGYTVAWMGTCIYRLKETLQMQLCLCLWFFFFINLDGSNDLLLLLDFLCYYALNKSS